MVSNDFIADQLSDKDDMKANMSRSSSDLIQYVVFDYLQVQQKITSISGSIVYMNDSFILGHPINGIMYSGVSALLIDDMEDNTDWAEGSNSESLVLSDNSTAGHFWIGTQGVKATWSSTMTGIGIIESTVIQQDIKEVTGVTSGAPTRGTAGIWVYTADGSDITGVTLRIGSSSSDYKEYIGQTFGQRGGFEASFAITDSVRTYIMFDLDNPDDTAGTVNWTAMDFVQLRWTIVGTGDITFDYHTASKNNNVAGCGMGDRREAHINQFTKTILL